MRGALLLLLLLALGCGKATDVAPELHGVSARTGQPLRLRDDRGRVVMLSFGYTSCVEICPDTLLKAKGVLSDLADRARDVHFIYATVDPDRDTPAVLRGFLEQADTRFDGLYAKGPELDALLRDYHVTTRKRLPDAKGHYTMDHTSGFWVIDRRGLLRLRFAHDASEATISSGVKRLVDEKPPVRVESAEVRVAGESGALYARVVNDGDDDVRLVSVDSPQTSGASLHDVIDENGVTSMRLASSFVVRAHHALALEHGKRHVMLFGVHPDGGRLHATLHFDRGVPIAVDAPARSALE